MNKIICLKANILHLFIKHYIYIFYNLFTFIKEFNLFFIEI